MRNFRFSLFLFAIFGAHSAWATAPTVVLTYPVVDVIISEALTPNVLLQASVTDVDDSIDAVSFYVCLSDGATCIGLEPDVGDSFAPPYQVQWSSSASLPAGGTLRYLAWAKAFNSHGQMGQSIKVPFTMVQIPSLSVTLVAPSRESGYVTPTVPVLYATANPGATSPASTIAMVDFLDGGNVIGSVSAPNSIPSGYAFAWQDASPGMHLVAARAFDTLGNSRTSKAVTVYVIGPDPPPVVTLTAPVTGQIFAPLSIVPLAATASSTLGTIQRVEFATGNTVIGVVLSPPYVTSWVNPPPGNFAIVATAFDDIGVAATSPAGYIQVLAVARSPGVVLTAPAPGNIVSASAPITLAADALSPDGSIGRVDFSAGATLLGSTPSVPYRYVWTNPSSGAVSLIAKAYDLQGLSGVSAPVAITVRSNPPPTVSLTSPATGGSYAAPATITLGATASATGASVARVDFYASATLIGTSATSPYAMTWNNVGAGTYTLTAKATDTLGTTATSAAVLVAVNANQPPMVALFAPTGGQSFAAAAPITVSASATDPDGTIAKVEFYDGVTLIGAATATPYQMTWLGAAPGSHTLTAKATDNQSALGTSAAITISVTSNASPTVVLTQPRAGQAFSLGASIALAATASDDDGTIVRVDFYTDGVMLATATAAPYRATWSGAAAGVHTLTAKAIDDRGAVTTSAGMTVQVLTPTLTIATPTANATIAADFVLVSGTYSGPQNSGVSVNGVTARNDGQGHYFVNNLPLANGANTLTATLTTQDGQTTSQTQTITSTGTAPMQLYAESDGDFATATFTIKLLNRTASTITHISYPNLGGGQLDTSTVDQTTLGKITYVTPGAYMPGFVITDAAGNTYTQTVAVLAQDKAALDRTLKAVWADFTNALVGGDTTSQLQKLGLSAQVKYAQVFVALAPHFAEIIPRWSPPVTGALTTQIGEYGISRTTNGIKHLFLIYIVRDSDGIWRLDSL